MSAVVLAAVLMAGAVVALCRALKTDRRNVATFERRRRTADEVLEDARDWKSAALLKKCQDIWPDAPLDIPHPRKEES